MLSPEDLPFTSSQKAPEITSALVPSWTNIPICYYSAVLKWQTIERHLIFSLTTHSRSGTNGRFRFYACGTRHRSQFRFDRSLHTRWATSTGPRTHDLLTRSTYYNLAILLNNKLRSLSWSNSICFTFLNCSREVFLGFHWKMFSSAEGAWEKINLVSPFISFGNNLPSAFENKNRRGTLSLAGYSKLIFF